MFLGVTCPQVACLGGVGSRWSAVNRQQATGGRRDSSLVARRSGLGGSYKMQVGSQQSIVGSRRPSIANVVKESSPVILKERRFYRGDVAISAEAGISAMRRLPRHFVPRIYERTAYVKGKRKCCPITPPFEETSPRQP